MADRYWVGNSGNWSDTAHWALTNGGSGGESVPTSLDNVFFTTQSFNTSGQIVNIDQDVYCRNLLVNVNNSPVINPNGYSINSYGNNFEVIQSFVFNLQNTNIVFDMSLGLGVTVKLPDSYTQNLSFRNSVGSGTELVTLNVSKIGILEFLNPPYNVKFMASGWYTIDNLIANGSAGSLFTFYTSIEESYCIIICASGIINLTYCSIKDLHVSGGATWKAYFENGCVDVSGNDGWIWRDPLTLYWRGNKWTSSTTQYSSNYTYYNGDMFLESVSCDSDGSNVITCSSRLYVYGYYYYGRLWTSSDYGETWTERQPAGNVERDWISCASDSDGSHLIVCADLGRVFTSSTFGVSWVERQPAGSVDRSWRCVSSDGDGSTLIACCGSSGTDIYVSTDYGLGWNNRNPGGVTRYWSSCASDSSGSNLIACSTSTGGRLFTSTNSGVSWTERQPEGNIDKNWACVASDSDGSNLIAGVRGGRLYTSINSGSTWQEVTPEGSTDQLWKSVSSNSDGTVLSACVEYGNVYISTDSGATWKNSTPRPATGHSRYRRFTGTCVSSDSTFIYVCNRAYHTGGYGYFYRYSGSVFKYNNSNNGTGFWFSKNSWASSYSGVPGDGYTFPTLQDTLIFDDLSFYSNNDVIIFDGNIFCNNLDFRNITFTPKMDLVEAYFYIYSEIHLKEGMTVNKNNFDNYATTGFDLYGDTIVDLNGVDLQYCWFYIEGDGDRQIISNMVICGLTDSDGTYTEASVSFLCDSVTFSGDYPYYEMDELNIPIDIGECDFIFDLTTQNLLYGDGYGYGYMYLGNPQTYYNIIVKYDTPSNNSNSFLLGIYEGDITLNSIQILNPATLIVSGDGSSKIYLNDFICDGEVDNLSNVEMDYGTITTFSKSSGEVNITYTNLTDSVVEGGAEWNSYLMNGNTDGGGNSGWNWYPPFTLYLEDDLNCENLLIKERLDSQEHNINSKGFIIDPERYSVIDVGESEISCRGLIINDPTNYIKETSNFLADVIITTTGE